MLYEVITTWATVGSCAYIGKNVHLSGGVGIGGVLEPIQVSPTIIEDNCFIGARSEVVEGVIIRITSYNVCYTKLLREAGLSIDEIASVTGCNRETAKSRLRYAVNKLRDAIEEPQ